MLLLKNLWIESRNPSCRCKSFKLSLLLSNIAFQDYLLLIWLLQTFVAIDTESCERLFPNFCTLPSEVAVLFNWNLSRLSFLAHVVDLDLLFRTGFNKEHAEWSIERLSEAMSEALVSNCFSSIPLLILISFSIINFMARKKKVNSHGPKNYKALNPELSQYSKCGRLVARIRDCSKLGNALLLWLPN